MVAGFKMQWMLQLITYFFINCRLHFINLSIIRQIILDHASSCQVWNFLSLILDLSKTGILILKFFYYELALHHISVKWCNQQLLYKFGPSHIIMKVIQNLIVNYKMHTVNLRTLNQWYSQINVIKSNKKKTLVWEWFLHLNSIGIYSN